MCCFKFLWQLFYSFLQMVNLCMATPPHPCWWGTDLQWEYLGHGMLCNQWFFICFFRKKKKSFYTFQAHFAGATEAPDRISLWRSGSTFGFRVIIWVITDLSAMSLGTSTGDWSQKTWVWGSTLLGELWGSEQVALKTKTEEQSVKSQFSVSFSVKWG